MAFRPEGFRPVTLYRGTERKAVADENQANQLLGSGWQLETQAPPKTTDPYNMDYINYLRRTSGTEDVASKLAQQREQYQNALTGKNAFLEALRKALGEADINNKGLKEQSRPTQSELTTL